MPSSVAHYLSATVDHWEVGVAITKPEEDIVYEAQHVRGVKAERNAIAQVLDGYTDDQWDVVRIRFVKKVFANADV